MTENIREFCNIFLNAVKRTGEQVSQIMRKHLPGVYICFITQGFHFTPDVCAAYRLARAGHKNHTVFNVLLCCKAEQFLLVSLDVELNPRFYRGKKSERSDNRKGELDASRKTLKREEPPV